MGVFMMSEYSEMSREELIKIKEDLDRQYDQFKSRGLKLDMSRGKPGKEQLDLSLDMLGILKDDDYRDATGIDCRNYGGLDGLPELKQIFAEILDIEPDELIIGGNSSLALMFDSVASNTTHGVRGGTPWAMQGKIKFLCPSPGYDRHFSICEYMHIDMIPVKMTPTGPDMDEVERLVASDKMIKGIWCVPKYSNPDGITYSDETVYRMANLKPAADDFRIYWDNAYCIHHINGKLDKIPNILRECEKAGNPNMPMIFTSFSKVSFPGSAVSCIASSKDNIKYIKERFSVQTIGPDKLNQLRHIRFFKNTQGVYDHMNKHAAIIRPKFEAVINALEGKLSGKGVARWMNPTGGYFISVYVMNGCAKRVVQLCKEAGVVLTGAGATYPYGNDPDDSNIRLAPTYPSTDELKTAMDLFCLSVQIAAIEKLLNK